jgi:hypothetical protein
MRADDFRAFIGFFTEDGRDINATDENGATLLQLIAEHRKSADFRNILQAAGAQ